MLLPVVNDIVSCDMDKELKLKELKQLKEDIEIAEKIISGEFTYCSDCKDYYLTESFISQTKTENKKIRIYSDPINSGGDEYESYAVKVKYSICPKGHIHEVKD